MSQLATISLLLLFCWAVQATGNSLEEKYRSLVQASDYHLQELQKNVQKLHLLKKQMVADDMSRRSLEANLLPSLLVFCDALKNPHKYRLPIPSQNSTVQEIPQTSSANQSSISTGASRIPSPKEHNGWQEAGPAPVRIEVSEEDGDINMTFEVRSNRAYKVVRTTKFLKSRSKDVKKKKSSGQVSFSFPRRQCISGVSERITFLAKDQESVSLSVPACRQLELAANSSGETRISEDISLPQYKLLGQNWDDIKVEKGHNTTIELEVNFNTTQRLSITATVYDIFKGEFINSDLLIHLRNATSKLVVDTWSSTNFLVQVQELDPVVDNTTRNLSHGNTGDEHSQDRGLDRKMRLTVNTDSGHISGYLVFNFYKQGREDSLISYIIRNKIFALKKPGQKHALPQGKFFFGKPREFYCQPYNKMDEEEDCLVFCSVMGRGISSLSISRQDTLPGGGNTVLRWKQTNHGVMSTLWVSLGPRNESLHGEYTCEVTDNRGVTDSMTFKVNAASPPRVDRNMTLIMDLQNGSVLLRCVGTGRPPLNATIYVDEFTEDGVVEPDLTQTSSVGEFKEEVSTSALVSTTSLQWPRSWVYCRLKSNEGWDEYSMNIMDHVKNYYGT